MAQKGITKETIIKKAVETIEDSGTPEISMRELAEKLNIKTPSLYNHIKSLDELLSEVGHYAAEQLKNAQLEAMKGKKQDEAVCALAGAYRAYAKEHSGLYKVIMSSPQFANDSEEHSAADMVVPALQVLSDYGLQEDQLMHWQRVLRGLIHGFIAQEDSGFFSHYTASVDDSFQIAIRCFINGLNAEREAAKNAR